MSLTKENQIMEAGVILKSKYRVDKLLGKGGTGFVYMCTNIELGNKWALKHIPSDGIRDKSISEIEILKKLYHVSLPRIADVFSDEKGLYIIESNIEGIDLDSLLRSQGSFSIDRVIDWSLELCDILEYLHELKPRPIIYRDLKPSNIMLSKGNRLVLVDFGISKEYSKTQVEDTYLAGTGIYAAPEQLIKGGLTDSRTDIYNLGATIYQLLYGRPPGLTKDYSVPGRGKAMSRINSIISRCMESKPENRYQRMEDIRQELQAVKTMLVVGRERKGMIDRLEGVLVVILSAISYIIAFMGMAGMLP